MHSNRVLFVQTESVALNVSIGISFTNVLTQNWLSELVPKTNVYPVTTHFSFYSDQRIRSKLELEKRNSKLKNISNFKIIKLLEGTHWWVSEIFSLKKKEGKQNATVFILRKWFFDLWKLQVIDIVTQCPRSDVCVCRSEIVFVHVNMRVAVTPTLWKTHPSLLTIPFCIPPSL